MYSKYGILILLFVGLSRAVNVPSAGCAPDFDSCVEGGGVTKYYFFSLNITMDTYSNCLTTTMRYLLPSTISIISSSICVTYIQDSGSWCFPGTQPAGYSAWNLTFSFAGPTCNITSGGGGEYRNRAIFFDNPIDTDSYYNEPPGSCIVGFGTGPDPSSSGENYTDGYKLTCNGRYPYAYTPTTGEITTGGITTGGITTRAITSGAITSGAVTSGEVTSSPLTTHALTTHSITTAQEDVEEDTSSGPSTAITKYITIGVSVYVAVFFAAFVYMRFTGGFNPGVGQLSQRYVRDERRYQD